MEALTASREFYEREMKALTVPGPEPPLTPEQAIVRGLLQKGMEAPARNDKTEASRWFQQAADAGGVDVMRAVGRFYQASQDVTEAVRWCEEAADRGDAEAMYDLG